jgi:hypothetical protein
MAALMPTVDAVMRPAFGRPKIMEALELFGVRAAPRQGAKALKELEWAPFPLCTEFDN